VQLNNDALFLRFFLLTVYSVLSVLYLKVKSNIMAITQISEFTFSFAFLREHVNRRWNRIRAVPCLPSLKLEHTCGYDANIVENGTIFFYQFKTSKYKRSRFSNSSKPDEYYNKRPYFKFYLHPNENYLQHTRLLELATDFPDTYYIAPCLTNSAAFSDAFFSGNVMDTSRRVHISLALPVNENTNHFITYQTLVDTPKIWSKNGKLIKWENYSNFEDFYLSSRERFCSINHDYFSAKLPKIQKIGQKSLHKKFLKPFERKMDTLSNLKDIKLQIEGLAEIMKCYFNLTTILVGDPK